MSDEVGLDDSLAIRALSLRLFCPISVRRTKVTLRFEPSGLLGFEPQ